MAKSKSKDMKLAAAGFQDVDSTVVPRLICSICGLEKQGKTHFALTAPGPIAMISTDEGEEGVVEKFLDSKRITKVSIDVPQDEELENDEAKELWDKTRKAYYAALESDVIRSVLVDTGTEVWELLRLYKFGKLTQVMPYQYGPVNKIFRRMIRDAYKYDKNVLFLHKMKPKYVNDKRTAEYERAGFNDMGFLVQLNAQVWRYSADEGGEFCITVTDSRHNPDMAGETLEGDMCTFPMLAMMVMPEVDSEVWE